MSKNKRSENLKIIYEQIDQLIFINYENCEGMQDALDLASYILYHVMDEQKIDLRPFISTVIETIKKDVNLSIYLNEKSNG